MEYTRLRDDVKRLRTARVSDEIFGASSHGFLLNAPLSEEAVQEVEAEHNITLPPDYRAFLTQVGNGGAGPAYGVFRWGEIDKGFEQVPWSAVPGSIGDLAAPFPHTEPWNDLTGRPDLSEDEDDFDEDEYEEQSTAFEEQYFAAEHLNGAIPICHRGCGLHDVLVLTGPEAGNVWRDDRADHDGLRPLSRDGVARMTFTEWYRLWLDDALKLLPSGIV